MGKKISDLYFFFNWNRWYYGVRDLFFMPVFRTVGSCAVLENEGLMAPGKWNNTEAENLVYDMIDFRTVLPCYNLLNPGAVCRMRRSMTAVNYIYLIRACL